MRKVIIIFSFIIGLILATNLPGQYRNHKNHLEELKTLYPYGLLTDDFGILTPDDLAMNSCGVDVIPFSEDSNAYPYWQCFPVKQIKFWCDPAGPDDETKKETAILWIDIISAGKQYQYVPRRAMDMGNCQWFEHQWKIGTLKQEFACLSGSYAGLDKDSNNNQVSIWVFDKFKTKKLCSSYFYGHCSLKYLRKNGCNI